MQYARRKTCGKTTTRTHIRVDAAVIHDLWGVTTCASRQGGDRRVQPPAERVSPLVPRATKATNHRHVFGDYRTVPLLSVFWGSANLTRKTQKKTLTHHPGGCCDAHYWRRCDSGLHTTTGSKSGDTTSAAPGVGGFWLARGDRLGRARAQHERRRLC